MAKGSDSVADLSAVCLGFNSRIVHKFACFSVVTSSTPRPRLQIFRWFDFFYCIWVTSFIRLLGSMARL